MATDNGIRSFWNGLDRTKQWSLASGAAVCIVLTIAVLVWTTRQNDEVLFSQLAEEDAAAIVGQLKRQKIPYSLADRGATIKVAAERVHETRLGLMSGGVPLSGGVGFELFDRQGLGATEQSQRVSFQRALQGELARTIGALDNVRHARVHLVLPEASLFKRDRQEPKAAVTLTLAPATQLSREQIIGVQRLVAASVQGLDVGRVVVTDQRGITLSGVDMRGDGAQSTQARLAMKLEIEEYITRKVVTFLDRTYGPGQAIVSADVTLNFDEIKRTVESLLPVPGADGMRDSGGLKRKRQVSSSRYAEPDAALEEDAAAASKAGNSSTEVEYEFGRKVEQVIAAPGGITRLSIGVVIPGELSAEKQQRVTDLVRMAAGIDEQRGDAVVIQPLDRLSASVQTRDAVSESSLTAAQAGAPTASSVDAMPRYSRSSLWLTAIVGILLITILALRARYANQRRVAMAPELQPRDRERLLADLRKTLTESAPAALSRKRI